MTFTLVCIIVAFIVSNDIFHRPHEIIYYYLTAIFFAIVTFW